MGGVWLAIWLVALVDGSGHAAKYQLTSKDLSFQTKEECLAYIEKWRPHMPDFIRGMANIPFENPVKVESGDCTTKDGA